MKKLFVGLTIAIFTLFGTTSSANFGAFSGVSGAISQKNLGLFEYIVCSVGLSCSRAGTKLIMSGVGQSLSTSFFSYIPSAFADATSVAGVNTDVYMTQLQVANNANLTGVQLAINTATNATRYIAVLFSSAGVPLAHSALAGTLDGVTANSYLQLPFTAPFTVQGFKTYWVGIYPNNNTDHFFAIPAVGAPYGLAGLVTGQTFGTVASVVPPVSFTAGQGPVVYTY